MVMDIVAVRHLWGLEGDPLSQLDALAERGYGGLEGGSAAMGPELRADLERRGWLYVAQLWSDHWNWSGDPRRHLESVAEQARQAADGGAAFLNIHAGEDWWDVDTAAAFLEDCAALIEGLGVPWCMETHRGRIASTPWSCRQLCQRLPWLRLTADYSHWVAVCERPLIAMDGWLAEFAPRVDHLHTRIGHSQGPQVADPWSPAHTEDCAAHLKWWDAIIAERRGRGCARSTFCPEFGPAPYLPQGAAPLAATCDRLTAELLARWRSIITRVDP